jgi:hypothetical protein
MLFLGRHSAPRHRQTDHKRKKGRSHEKNDHRIRYSGGLDQPRIDTSDHIWFANDQLAARFIEEIDFDYAADATAALLTAAS